MLLLLGALGDKPAAGHGGGPPLARLVGDGEGNGVLPLGDGANVGALRQLELGAVDGRADGAQPERVERRLAHTAPPIARSGVSE